MKNLSPIRINILYGGIIIQLYIIHTYLIKLENPKNKKKRTLLESINSKQLKEQSITYWLIANPLLNSSLEFWFSFWSVIMQEQHYDKERVY